MVKIINYDTRAYEKRNIKLFPNILRCAILGPSGSGKTNILLNILANIKKLPRDIYTKNSTFSNKYEREWTTEIFMIRKIHYTEPITYSIKDLDGDEINGKFYK